MMGSGKSSVGRKLARRLGCEFIDTDERVAERAQAPISEIFAREGEAHFRSLERAVLEELPERNAVVALGGGAVTSEANRAILQRKGTIVLLEALPETLAQRLADAADRPLLHGTRGTQRVARLRALRAERADAYAAADFAVETDGRNVDEVCSAVLAALGWECAA
jgi:shikimate kinase